MIDLEYMDRAMDFTLHETFTDLPDFTENVLHKNDMKLVLIFDPAICKEGGYEDLSTGNSPLIKIDKMFKVSDIPIILSVTLTLYQ